MRRGQIVGEVWATRKASGLAGRQLKLVALADGPVVVAVDTLDARRGQDVLVAFGSGARNVVQRTVPGAFSQDDNRGLLCDAAVALLIDEPDRNDREV